MAADKQPTQCFSVGQEPLNDRPLTLGLLKITATSELLSNESQPHPCHRKQISHGLEETGSRWLALEIQLNHLSNGQGKCSLQHRNCPTSYQPDSPLHRPRRHQLALLIHWRQSMSKTIATVPEYVFLILNMRKEGSATPVWDLQVNPTQSTPRVPF